MSSPQLENGYTPIANELLEALFQSELSRCEYQIVLAIIRKTYGYHKKEASIGNSQLALMTGIDRRNVGRTIRALSEKNILLRGTDTNTHTIGLNKQYKEWFLPKLPVQLASRPIKTDVMDDVNITESDVIHDVELLADDYKNIPDFLQTDVTTDALTDVKNIHFSVKTDVMGDTHKIKYKESEINTLLPLLDSTAEVMESESPCGGGNFSYCVAEEKPTKVTTSLIFPYALGKEEREAARVVLQNCKDDAQAILDVLAAAMVAGKIQTSPLALLGGLVRRYSAGSFDPTPGLRVKLQRDKMTAKPPPVRSGKPPDKARTMQHLAAFLSATNLRNSNREL
jgi:phage replication O-like protein O